jgi:hypothetical protein
MREKITSLWNRLKTWWASLPKWKKIVIILTVLVAVGLLTWWLISISTATATVGGIHGAGNVYVMSDGVATKIGLTGRDVAVRAAEISSYAPGTEIIGSISVDNMLAVENMAHGHFAASSIPSYLGSIEWFNIPPASALKYLSTLV